MNHSGWTVSDEAGHTYAPRETTVESGADVTLRTGSGTDTALYWAASGAIWNNDGDTVTVRNESGAIVLRETY